MGIQGRCFLILIHNAVKNKPNNVKQSVLKFKLSPVRALNIHNVEMHESVHLLSVYFTTRTLSLNLKKNKTQNLFLKRVPNAFENEFQVSAPLSRNKAYI